MTHQAGSFKSGRKDTQSRKDRSCRLLWEKILSGAKATRQRLQEYQRTFGNSLSITF